ncbi:hypothetical protein LTR34_003593 [Exophiala xenobiotica]|uniref:F-box domain-containing protein n=1 Tax=Vermiconidia calcicola TaxID=1690605 RepID=A0AAV9QF93_9PEZI|nr:hypothetical protein LTR34_003593 [Exophiala xenobiotica]KAK5542313.1 hypothetical protein LTR25_002198 [Vermiconidia calcicola]KAK5546171.1 hypothetical protein LTR23_003622 [Chaetothyriales sp. CCFEE 6169]
MDTDEVPTLRPHPSAFELLITCNPPILQSLLAQVPTDIIFRLYQTSSFLRDFFTRSPTSWRYISWRLSQPTASTVVAANGDVPGHRQSSNYALDQILLNVINPFSTRLVSLELDNTAVSGATLTSTVLILRRDTLQHVSVRGCKNVSLKYHINPWLQMHALARESQSSGGPIGFETLALKSLYTYRCRHHRRRPYLPSSLARKESDSEPTHELVLTCHKLGIWTDTAWCTTPGARCFRRRGYVKMRMPQDPREVWVVYDRLWRSRNWLGPVEPPRNSHTSTLRKRRRDCRSWEYDEEGVNGEPTGMGKEGKSTPAHLRQSHKRFVEDIFCHNCAAQILERCEQCSVMMHCSGCRKTLCASCAFDRPYLRNKNASEEERNKFWWAPGSAVSPCSMQDQDLPANTVIGTQNPSPNQPPNIKFRWCCTEPVFSGGGGITFGNNNSRETDRIRAAPLSTGQGWEDPEFGPERLYLEEEATQHLSGGPGGRWSTIDGFFQAAETLGSSEHPSTSIPRVLCDECYSAEHWRLKCKACATALCLKHDIGDRMKARICGYRDVLVERQDYKSRQKALKLLATLVRHRKKRLAAEKPVVEHPDANSTLDGASSSRLDLSTSSEHQSQGIPQRPVPSDVVERETEDQAASGEHTLLFFCPNCRWDRMLSGKCKRKSEAFLAAQSMSKKLRKRKDKMRKPIEERRLSGSPGSLSAAEEAIDGLVEFFTSLSMQYAGMSRPQDLALVSRAENHQHMVAAANLNDIQELEDMGALARDLIRRIQRLRDQFRPGSLAALALPDIRVEDDVVGQLPGVPGHLSDQIPHEDPELGLGAVQVQHLPVHGLDENELIIVNPEEMDDDDEEEEEEVEHLEGRESGSD